jgi:ketopantoate reductase
MAVESILHAPLLRARELGLDVPMMSALYALVDAADGRREGH